MRKSAHSAKQRTLNNFMPLGYTCPSFFEWHAVILRVAQRPLHHQGKFVLVGFYTNCFFYSLHLNTKRFHCSFVCISMLSICSNECLACVNGRLLLCFLFAGGTSSFYCCALPQLVNGKQNKLIIRYVLHVRKRKSGLCCVPAT